MFCSEIYHRKSGLPPIIPFSAGEASAFAALISAHHKDDEDLKEIVPINPENKELFNATSNGVLLWYV